jgi:hypothetical protein
LSEPVPWSTQSPHEPGPLRLDDVWGPNGVLPASDRVPAPYYKPLEHAGAGVPPKELVSLLLALCWGLVVSLMPLSWVAELILRPAGYVAGLVLGIRGRGEALDRFGRILAELAIIYNAINLAWSVYGLLLWYGVSLRGLIGRRTNTAGLRNMPTSTARSVRSSSVDRELPEASPSPGCEGPTAGVQMARPARGASVPEFMDVHRNMKGITPEDLLKAHQADLDVQDQENADFKQAWGDPVTGMVFCLSEAPSKEAVMRTHERAGHPTDEVYEITATA